MKSYSINSHVEERIELLQKYLQHRGVSLHTQKAYVQDCLLFERYLNSEQLDFFHEGIYKKYFQTLFIQKLAPTTLRRKKTSIRQYQKIVFEHHHMDLPKNELDQILLPKKKASLPKDYTLEEVKMILSQISGQTLFEESLTLLCLFLFGLGLRIKEALALRPQDIHDDGSLFVRQGKGGKSRILFVHEHILEQYRSYYRKYQHLCDAYQVIFLNKQEGVLVYSQVYQAMKELEKKIETNQQVSKKIRPHRFRHTFATWLLNEGANIRYISQALGHTSLDSTSIYTRVHKQKLRSFIQEFHPHG